MAVNRVRQLIGACVVMLSLASPTIPSAAAQVEVVVSGECAPLEKFAAEELQRCLGRLFSMSPAVVAAPSENGDFLFFVGTREHAGGFPGAALPVPLTGQGFLLRRTPWKQGTPSMTIVGGSPVAVLWGVYELGERYGVRYLLDGDVYPEPREEIYLPEIDQVFEPVFRVRMWKTMGDFAFGMEGWSMAQYRPFIDQLAKLKFNRIRVSSGPSQPFLGLKVEGVTQQTATLWYGARFPITEDMPGRALFGNETEFWNPDLPLPEAGAEALIAAGEKHCHELIAYAHSRGIESSFVGSITDFPKEFAAVLPETEVVQQLGQLTVSPGPSVRPDNPDLLRVAGSVLRTLLSTYNEVDSYGFPAGTEWPSWIDLYTWAWQELDARYRIGEVTTLDAVLEDASRRVNFTGGPDRAVRQVKGDLAGLCFLDRLRTDVVPVSAKPGARFVYYEVAEELFPILPRVMPGDTELLIVLDYTPTRVLRRREAFDRIPAGEVPTILALTLQDDGVGVPPQLTTGSLHELVREMRDHGLAGFCTRQWMISDLDPAVAYLTKAAWDPATTPDSAYRDFIRAVCSEEAVEPMLQAFSRIEAATAALEDHGLGIGFPVPTMIMRHWSAGPFPEELAKDREDYRAALELVRQAPRSERKEAQSYVDYWNGRLEFAVGFFDTIETVMKAATAEAAAREAQQQTDSQKYKAQLAEAADYAEAARTVAFKAIDTLAKVARNQSDRGAVATMAEYIYRPLKNKAQELRTEYDVASKPQ